LSYAPTAAGKARRKLDYTIQAVTIGARGSSITPRQLPDFARLPPSSSRKMIRDTLVRDTSIRESPACERAAPRFVRALAGAVGAQFFQSPGDRARRLRTKRRTCSHSTNDQSIVVPTDAALAAAARKNSGTSKSDMRAARNLAAHSEGRSAYPVRQRHR